MSHLLTTLIGLLSLILTFTFYLASTDIPKTLSPQGCRMSWMSPSYILQSGFNSSWSPLAERYSLWLYREVGWEGTPVNGVPVLFIPGNAGSSRQVRSIASSATRQFYQSPYVVSEEFARRVVKPLDFYAVEFNEDLSAFHGPTLDSQISYSSRAISYILSHYPPNTSIIIMGHSMGGIVGTSLLPSADISAVITMSTPHTLPPARFDSRIDRIYARNQHILRTDSTPILSLCGGATDVMIPSESCILPTVQNNTTESIFRRTVFTSALEGSWTGVGHLEMVWCHQVRWRVARAALELGESSSIRARVTALDRWMRVGNSLPTLTRVPQNDLSLADAASYKMLPADIHLILKRPQGSQTYLLPVPSSSSGSPSKFVLYVSEGSIPPVSPQHPNSLRVSVYICHRQRLPKSSAYTNSLDPPSCTTLAPSALNLLPNPIAGKPFPVPDEGFDESEGVVLFEADIQPSDPESTWVAVHTEDANNAGWIVGGFSPPWDNGGVVTSNAHPIGPFLSKLSIQLPASDTLRTEVKITNLLSSALIVYRITPAFGPTLPTQADSTCAGSLFAPLLMQTSYPSETHYFPLVHSPPRALLLHAHNSGPYVPDTSRGLNFTIYSSGSSGCMTGVDIQIDWWRTFGRWGSRYTMTALSWTVGVVALVLFAVLEATNKNMSLQKSLIMFTSGRFIMLLIGSFVVACLPLPTNYYLGNKGEPLLAPIAPVILFIVTGLVQVSCWMLHILIWIIGRMELIFSCQQSAGLGYRGTLVSMCLVLMLIFLFVPWQVAFLGCWAIHLHTCATLRAKLIALEPGALIPLMDRSRQEANDNPSTHTARLADQSPSTTNPQPLSLDGHHLNMHILLLMTWLLPFVAPVLVVWVRTLITAGFTVPFDGDHNFLNVAPFLLLVDSTSSGRGPNIRGRRWENHAVRWSFVILAMMAIFPGPRTLYRVFDMANIVAAFIVIMPLLRTLGL